MSIILREYRPEDLPAMTGIWNEIVAAANAFPQTDPLSETEARTFFADQDYTGVAAADDKVLGLYILHPNNIGRCSHIANASFAVGSQSRGKGVGELLVRDCLSQGKRLGFRILQFNAVLEINTVANHLYEKLGFHKLGTIPGGFRLNDGEYTAINLYYIELA